MYWTNEDLLSLIAQSLVTTSNKELNDLLPLGPSSTIVLEIYMAKNSSNQDGLMISGYVDD